MEGSDSELPVLKTSYHNMNGNFDTKAKLGKGVWASNSQERCRLCQDGGKICGGDGRESSPEFGELP